MLNRRQRAVMESLLPPGEGLPSGLDSGLEEFLIRFDKTTLPSMRLGFAAALWTAIWLAPLLVACLPPISRLSTEDRERALEALGKSRFYLLRQLLLLLKAVTSFHYGAHPKVRQALGVPS